MGFPDAELPEITDYKLIAHESLIVLNINKNTAHMKLDLYFTDKPPIKGIPITVEGERVRCFRIDKPEDINGIVVPRKIQYAWVLRSDIEVIAQYGRLDTTQANMAFYTVMGFNI